MQGNDTRMLRVKAVAEMFDVSVNTIYRAIESGQLAAVKFGTGKGTVRIPADSLNAYLANVGMAPVEAAEGDAA